MEDSTIDFDQFWEGYSEGIPAEKIQIMGMTIQLRMDIPLKLLIQMGSTDSRDLSSMTELLSKLYGNEVFNQLLDKGLSLPQLPILMAWSIARIQGMEITFEEVAKQLKEVIRGKVLTSSNGIGHQLRVDSVATTE